MEKGGRLGGLSGHGLVGVSTVEPVGKRERSDSGEALAHISRFAHRKSALHGLTDAFSVSS